MKDKTYSQRVRSKQTLWHAWQAIRENGRTSRSKETQDEIRRFDQNALSEIGRINGRLYRGTYQFAPATGIAQKREGKSDRPIVRAPVGNRVVQRAILDVIQSDARLASLYNNKNSFGGLIGRGVGSAVRAAQDAIQKSGAKFYICSDIKGFFNDIRRDVVVSEMSEAVREPEFIDLFRSALNTELANMTELKNQGKSELFPIYEIGVAQGCCLSPLVGNIYLREFDQTINTEDVFCLRYIDDFIILGPSEKVVRAKFREAIRILENMGLSAYRPGDGTGKSTCGATSRSFDYLGCTIDGTTLRPSKKSWSRLKVAVTDSFDNVLRNAQDLKNTLKHKMTFAETINFNSRKLEGWIKQYSEFCNDQRVIQQWNESLQEKFIDFENQYFKLLKGHSVKDRAAILGFYDIHSAFQTRRMLLAKKKEREVSRGEVR